MDYENKLIVAFLTFNAGIIGLVIGMVEIWTEANVKYSTGNSKKRKISGVKQDI